MLQAGGAAGHDVALSWEEVWGVAVAVLSLVSATDVAEMGCWPFGGRRAFLEARESRRVAGAVR